ncbi:MAG: nucleotidyltransferase [Myxococcales bacterium]
MPGTAVVEDPQETNAHRRALEVLQRAGIEPMVGGAYALRAHTGIWRDTKDLDLFVRKDQIEQALDVLARAGYRTELTDPLWIGKAFDGDYFVDLIFSSGNGVASVDEEWRKRAVLGDVLGRPALLVPAEEMIWQKGYIQERERFDGADIHHLIRAKGDRLDWRHMLSRFADHWPVLLGHLVSFRFSFPSDKDKVPEWVMRDLLARQLALEDRPAASERMCRGTLLSRQQYMNEVEDHGYLDAREHEVAGWNGDSAYPMKRRAGPG